MEEIDRSELEFARKQDEILKMRFKRNMGKLMQTLIAIAGALILLLLVSLFLMPLFLNRL